jgi:hypothetical protein
MVSHLPLCAHRRVFPCRSTGTTRLVRCTECGAEFARIEEPGPHERTQRKHRQSDREQQARIERARERMFNP